MKQLIFVMILFTGLTAGAQLSYGPELGLNLSKISFTTKYLSTSIKPGLFIGGFANYAINTNISIQGELFYSLEGTKEKQINGSGSGSISTGYLHLPVLFRYSMRTGFYGEAGPQIGFLLSNKEKWGENKSDIKKYYKSTEFRLPVGLGYHFSNSLQGLSVNVRYSIAFSPFNKVSVNGGDLKNKVFSIGLQYNLVKQPL